MHTPCFPAWRAQLAALGHRTAHSLRQNTLAQFQQHLRDLLPAPLLSSEEDGPNSRERVFSLRLTFECFVWQMLNPQTACREVVRQVQALLRLQGRRPIQKGNGAYIQARQRLPRPRLEQALRATAQCAERRAGSAGQLAGRRVLVVDGSTTQLADTARNQRRYPQPSSQKPGCGFPVLRFVALMTLGSGAIGQVMFDSLRSHDLRLFHRLWAFLKPGDIVLGDRAFGEYTTAAQLPRRGVDVVARLHHQRKVDFSKGKRLAKGDGLFVWLKGCMQSRILSARQWQRMPAQITVRLIRFRATIRGFRNRRITLLTTLLDPQRYPAGEIIALYARRWRLELCLRDLKPPSAWKPALPVTGHGGKGTAGLPHRSQSGPVFDRRSRRPPFRGAGTRQLQLRPDRLRQYSRCARTGAHLKPALPIMEDLLLQLARDLVPLRPHRREPRAGQAPPKAYPLSTNHDASS